ncbi:uncharacterized protein IAS62_001741 [Cryptococcus decagattii]|uniref:L-2-hydroxyglutarate dehydrogenase, mitochondrial n=1 Tax=Cryptococcus decagattii TaxID=1859122 RepID=A0ABZ2ARC4_9TREE
MSISRAKFLRQVYPFKPPSTSVDHLVIGGGVIGLSVAAALVNKAGKGRTTFLVERRGQLGQETTNSEVIHSGIYYPLGSVKSRLCIQGRDMLYKRCEQFGIGHKRTGKIVVATSDSQVPYLKKLQAHSTHPSFLTASGDPSSSRITTQFLTGNEARELEPDLSPKIAWKEKLKTPITILRHHEKRIGEKVLSSWGRELSESIERSLAVDGSYKWRLAGKALGKKKRESQSMWRCGTRKRAGTVVACQGGPGVGSVSRLIYPCPSANVDHLGTHLTLDLDGHIKFGPDVQTIGTSADAARDPDFWQSYLAPSSSPELIAAFAHSVQDYLPTIDPSLLSPDYAGIRPNIAPPEAGFSDFLIRHVEQRKGFVELLGFNSPGLTSSLAVGEVVGEMVGRQVWNKKD